jgi:MFS family permease
MSITTAPAPRTRTNLPLVIFTLGVLFGVNTMNFFDRQVLSAVQEKIKDDWKLNDSQLGMLGTAFIVLYAVVGLPLGRLADVWRRKWILAAGVALWSVLTFASGLAWNFWSLFVFRLGVGVGEASCAPTANSLIGDLAGPRWRARAMSLFMVGLPVGLALSYLISGTIAKEYDWQTAFFVAGIPGMLLAVAALFMADPERGSAEQKGDAAHFQDENELRPLFARHQPFWAVVRRVLRLPTMWWLIASGALHNFNMYALGSFQTSMLIRFHGLDQKSAGANSALISGVGALGLFVGGWLGDLAFRRRVSGRLHVGWVGMAAAIPCLLLSLAAPRFDVTGCVVWLLLASVFMYTYYSTVYAVIQDIIAPPLRGMAVALYFCAMYLFGAALGPVATGAVSDFFARRAAGADPVTKLHTAIGLHDAMYLIPILDAALVLVLIAASWTVTGDYLLNQKEMEHSESGVDSRPENG